MEAPNIPKYIKKILVEFKEDIENNTVIVGDFNTSLKSIDRSSKPSINKEMVTLNSIVYWMDLIAIYRTLSSQSSRIYILLKCIWNILKGKTQVMTQNEY